MEDSQLIHIRQATTTRQAWDSLKNYYEKSTLTSKIFLLKRICTLKLIDGGNMEEHINTMLNLINKLKALGEILMENLVIAIFLMSSPDSYSTFIADLESRSKNELTLELVKGKLIDESRRRTGSEADESSKETALKATASKSAEKQEIKCFFCKKSGHLKKECRKYLKWRENKDKESKARLKRFSKFLFYWN